MRNGAAYRTYTYDVPQLLAQKCVPLLGQGLRRFNRASRFSKKWFPLFGVMRGNTLTDARAGMTAPLAYTYNNRNRHSALSGGSPARTATYIYNPLQQMISRVTNAAGAPTTIIHYIYDTDGHLILEANGSSAGATVTSLREYIWLPSNDNPANDNSLPYPGLRRGGGVPEGGGGGAANDNTPPDLPLAAIDVAATPVISMVHTDHLGRPVRMTSATRATTWSAVWTPWGAAHSVTGTTTITNNQNLRFPGQFFLIETGLAYNWHRIYDPATGRYTQPDPLRFVDGPSVYAYAGNSPYMYTDPDGRFIPALLVGAAAGVAFEYFLNGDCATWEDYAWAAGIGALPWSKVTKFISPLSKNPAFKRFLADEAGSGRLGGGPTRKHVSQVAAELQRRGWTVTGGGGQFKEEFLRPLLGGGRGGSYVDITAFKNGRTLRINTVDTLANGVTPTARELVNAARIRSQTPGSHLLLVPKP